MGLHPGRFTLRELVAMAEARASAAWDHTAALIAAMESIVSGQEVSPAKHHPYRDAKEARPASRATMSELKAEMTS